MEQSVDKAISIDEWTGETLSSSMVDDVFYILRMCSYRALDTANLQALTAILGQLNTLLATNLAQALEQRWKVLSVFCTAVCCQLSPCRRLMPVSLVGAALPLPTIPYVLCKLQQLVAHNVSSVFTDLKSLYCPLWQVSVRKAV